MKELNYNDLKFVFTVLEAVSRKLNQHPRYVYNALDNEYLFDLYKYADVNHCLSIEENIYDILEDNTLENGDYDINEICMYTLPDITEIGSSLAYLAEGINSSDFLEVLECIRNSQIFEDICNYNGAMWYAFTDEKLDFMYDDGDIDSTYAPKNKSQK